MLNMRRWTKFRSATNTDLLFIKPQIVFQAFPEDQCEDELLFAQQFY